MGTRLVVSYGAHIVMPYHKRLDALSEAARKQSSSGSPIGTTGRGIGPCYVDKYNRVGIRAEDLASPAALGRKLRQNLDEKNPIFERIYGEAPAVFDEIYEAALGWGKFITPYLGDSMLEIDTAIREGRGVLFEGAQGTLLDVDHGTYPFVTSSNCVAGGCSTGGVVAPGQIDRVIGVVKAYCTRVGEGPFPTEDCGDTGERLRESGAEFGATTGRPRRCGWLDLVALKYSVRVNGLDSIALTKLDVLSGLDEIKVCVAYRLNGDETDIFPGSAEKLAAVTPVYTTLRSWGEDISGCRSFGDLPQAARDYVSFIEESASVNVGLIGVGPGREDTIIRDF
jgi:adenylosuccinate synthase